MQQVFTGKIEVARIEPDDGKAKAYGRVRVHIPVDAATAAGMAVDGKIAARFHSAGRLLISASTSPGSKISLRAAVDGFHVIEFIGTKRGIPSVDFPPTSAALTLTDFGLVLFVPEAMPKKYVAPADGKLAAAVDWHQQRIDKKARMDARPTYLEATAGLYGAAKMLALDRHRNELLGAHSRGIELGQMLALLRNAGHRVEQMSPRLFRLDGKSATMSDLADAVRRIDADAVLVAEAA